MAEFPEVVLKEIFDFLGIRDRLRVRSTCKKWKFVADTLSHQQSVCIHSASYPYNERWCFSDQRVIEEEMVHLKYDPEASRTFDLRMKFFQNLQKLYLFCLDEKVNLFLNELNHLTRLKVLMIEEDTIQSRTLNLPSIEMLSLRSHHLGNLQLNTPNLSSLILWNGDHEINAPAILEFGFPLKIKHLRCTEFTQNLGQLKSLETLVCIRITFDFRLSQFKSLVRAELWSLDAFRTVQDQKRRLDRTNLNVLASGFDGETVAKNPPEIQEQFFCEPSFVFRRESLDLNQSFLKKAGSNQWKLAGSVPWKFQLDFVGNIGSFEGRISQFFFNNKFRTDRIFYSERDVTKTDQSSLLELSARGSSREFMAFRYTLSQDSIERLSRIQSLQNLNGICHIESADCLLNLKNLESLEIYSSKISINFICRLFKELKFFFYLYFHSNESSGFHLHIDYRNYPLEDRVADGIAADALYSLSYQWESGSVDDPTDLGPIKKMNFKNINELIEGLKKVSEDKVAQSFFV